MNNSFAVIAALLLSLGEMSRSFEMLIIGRFIMGVDSGKCFINFTGGASLHNHQACATVRRITRVGLKIINTSVNYHFSFLSFLVTPRKQGYRHCLLTKLK